MDAVVEVFGLVKRYGSAGRGLLGRFGGAAAPVTAVDGLDLAVGKGECFALLGPNGAGKTTTLETIVGLTVPDEGAVRVFGLPWKGEGRAIRERLGMALQEARFPERLSVREVVSLFRSFYARGNDVDALVARMGLSEKRHAWTSRLSGGQRQRLALACALAGDPELLVLDEPTTGLDPQARRMIGDLVREQAGAGRTVLLSTHYMEEAESLCDRVAVVDRGRVIALGSPAALVASLGGEEVVEFEVTGAALPEGDLSSLPAVSAVRRRGETLCLSSADGPATVEALFRLCRGRGAAVSRLTVRRATLEDVYVSITGRELRDAG